MATTFNTTSFENNSSNFTDNFVRDESLARVEILLQIIIFVLAVLGNSTVLISLLLKKKRLSRMHLLMIHLSVADLFVAFGSVLPQIAWDVTFTFKGGDALCRLVKYMQVVAIYASSYVLVITAIDRYVAICYPFTSRKWSSNMVHKMVSVAWALSLIFSVPQMFIFSYKTTPYGQLDCWASFDPVWTLTLYITVFTILVYILPTGILTFCYSNICVEVWRSSIGDRISRLSKRIRVAKSDIFANKSYKAPSANTCGEGTRTIAKQTDVEMTQCDNISNGSYGNNSYTPPRNSLSNIDRNGCNGCTDNTQSLRFKKDSMSGDLTSNISKGKRKTSVGLSRAKIKTVELTLTVVLCYFLCWSPFFIAQMWAAWDESAPFYGAPYTIILLLASLNSCTNPWIYLLFSDLVCFGVKQYTYKLCRCKHKYTETATNEFH